MSPRRYFSHFSNMPMPDYDENLNLGPNMWFAFTAITGISKLFTYTPPILQEQQPQAADSQGIEDTLDTKSL
jgi:hypothetical protein